MAAGGPSVTEPEFPTSRVATVRYRACVYAEVNLDTREVLQVKTEERVSPALRAASRLAEALRPFTEGVR
jgi:hypothetical protein